MKLCFYLIQWHSSRMVNSSDTAVWGIHAGKDGDADKLFLDGKCIGLGWHQVGDLQKIGSDREAFKLKVAETYPEKKAGAIPVHAGMLYRFVHEMRREDLVVYPSKRDRKVHIGRITGDYRYNPKASAEYPQQRAVDWLRAVPRTHFTQGALYEIGSALSFFQVRNYAEEFRAALEGKASTPAPVAQDETVAAVAEDTEQTTRDFVLKQLAQETKVHPFATFVAHLLTTMGYRTRVSPEGPDGGVDIVAHKDELGFEPPIIKVQVKSTEGSVGGPDVSALYGNVSPTEFGLVVTLGTFTNQAKNFAKAKGNLRLIDGEELTDLIFQHYDQFDSRYKGLLPLRRVFVPEPIESDE